MIFDLEKARKKVELAKVKAAKEEMEFRIMEREVDIDRLKTQLAIQEEKIKEIEASIDS